MKIALNYQIQEGPWGGGNRFARALAQAITAAGHVFTTRLEPDVDAIVITDPRWRNPAVTFTTAAILRHLLVHPDCVVIHRINECDERKNTRRMNGVLRAANYCADHTVFVGSWLRDLAVWRHEGGESVILNGADETVFHARGAARWDGTEPLRVVTHHWGANRMKGFDVYEALDALLDDPQWRGKVEFTYVGNLPPDARLRNTRRVAPLDGTALADELRSHHVYLTASINEPGGNHQNEGALCGLPLLYRNSGCMPEYCAGFGIQYEPIDFVAALCRMLVEYDQWRERVAAYPHTAAVMVAQWLELLDGLMARRDDIAARRRLFRAPAAVLRNFLPM